MVRDNAYTYDFAQDTVRGCGFDFVESLYIENLNSNGGFYDGTFSHNMEWLTVEAINFIDDAVSTVRTFISLKIYQLY